MNNILLSDTWKEEQIKVKEKNKQKSGKRGEALKTIMDN